MRLLRPSGSKELPVKRPDLSTQSDEDPIYDFGLGMQVEQTIEIKKMDSDFWDSMQDA
jgi:hypothetical protein